MALHYTVLESRSFDTGGIYCDGLALQCLRGPVFGYRWSNQIGHVTKWSKSPVFRYRCGTQIWHWCTCLTCPSFDTGGVYSDGMALQRLRCSVFGYRWNTQIWHGTTAYRDAWDYMSLERPGRWVHMGYTGRIWLYGYIMWLRDYSGRRINSLHIDVKLCNDTSASNARPRHMDAYDTSASNAVSRRLGISCHVEVHVSNDTCHMYVTVCNDAPVPNAGPWRPGLSCHIEITQCRTEEGSKCTK
jgi:hypothetical protein